MELEIVLLIVAIVLLAITIVLQLFNAAGGRNKEDRLLAEMKSVLSRSSRDNAESISDSVARLGSLLSEQQAQNGMLTGERLKQMEARLGTLEQNNEIKLDAMRRTLSESLDNMRNDNAKKLDEIRKTVDEQLEENLQKRITDSFRSVSEQLEKVYKGLGEMQTLAGDVGGLKQVLSGVKTRGILGEIQLGAILQEILPREQYEENFATIPGSSERVEFAIKLPGGGEGPVYLPIDSKFPGDAFAHLQEARENGDPEQVKVAWRELEQIIKKSGKDIREKYVQPPYTTNFGIMFLPFEGLYAEVVNSGLLEELQRTGINIAGPSTMAALLNSLQMGFRTLAIQKRSNEVWNVLSAVRTEFEKFGSSLSNMQKHLELTGKDLDALMGVRTRAITKKLDSIQKLEPAEEVTRLLEDPFEYIGED